jgi:hypothetical protein
MAGDTTVADLNSIIQVIVADVRLTARHATPMANLVTRISMPEHRGSPIDVPKLGTLTAVELTEGTDYTSFETATDSDVSIDPTEVGVFTKLTDRMLRRAPAGFERVLAGEAGRAYSYKLDLDLLRQLDSFSTSLAGASNVLQIGHLSAARARVKGGTEPGQGPVHVVVHPYGIKDLVDDLVPAAANAIPAGITDDITRQYLTENYVGTTKLYGMTVWEDGNIEIDASDDTKGGVFCENAIFLAITLEPTEETQRDASARGDEVVVVGEYGYAEWLDAAGVELYSDASAPTV